MSAVRVRQGLVLLAGAAAYLLLAEGPLDFDWTPLLLGLAYLAAAAVGGRHGGHWPTACVLVGWGLAVVLVREAGLEVTEGGAQVAGVGAGVVALALLARAGFDADLLGAGATALAAGILEALARDVDLLVEPLLYAVLLALVGVVNLALALSPGRGGAASPVRR
jgi:hypothetical protein